MRLDDTLLLLLLIAPHKARACLKTLATFHNKVERYIHPKSSPCLFVVAAYPGDPSSMLRPPPGILFGPGLSWTFREVR